MVHIFVAVGHAAIVGVGIERAGPRAWIGICHEIVITYIGTGNCAARWDWIGHASFGAVEDAVVVRVWIEHVDRAVAVTIGCEVRFLAISNAIVVGVTIARIRSQERFERISQAVTIGVDHAGVVSTVPAGRQGLGTIWLTVKIAIFAAVDHRAVIAVLIQWIGFGNTGIRVRHKHAVSWIRAIRRRAGWRRNAQFGAVK